MNLHRLSAQTSRASSPSPTPAEENRPFTAGQREGSASASMADSAASQAGVQLHIDRLVLEGLPFNRLESIRLEAALTQELSRRLQAEPALMRALAERPAHALAPSLRLPAGVRPEAAARALAHALLQPSPQPRERPLSGTRA